MGKSSGLLQTRTQPVITRSISGKTLGFCKNLGFFKPVLNPYIKPVLYPY